MDRHALGVDSVADSVDVLRLPVKSKVRQKCVKTPSTAREVQSIPTGDYHDNVVSFG